MLATPMIFLMAKLFTVWHYGRHFSRVKDFVVIKTVKSLLIIRSACRFYRSIHPSLFLRRWNFLLNLYLVSKSDGNRGSVGFFRKPWRIPRR